MDGGVCCKQFISSIKRPVLQCVFLSLSLFFFCKACNSRNGSHGEIKATEVILMSSSTPAKGGS